jgi:hypothetical protein
MACVVEGPLIPGRDDERITELTALATAQQKVLSDSNPLGGPAARIRSIMQIPPFDTMITPWESKFGIVPNWHFVAKTPAPDNRICGWLTAQLKDDHDRKYIYLSEISTRRIRDEVYGGVGTKLHEALLAAARAEKYDFIYLYPVNKKVAAVYEKWHYTKSLETLPHQFYVINLERGPTPAIKKDLLPPRPDVGVIQRAREVFGPEFDKYRRTVLANRGNIADVEVLLNEFDEENAAGELIERPRREKERAEIDTKRAKRWEEQRAQMFGSLESMSKGGSKTARNTHRLRFFRKHRLSVRGYSLGELSKVSNVSRPILQQVYDRGIGAYKTNPTSVRMKGTFRKGVKAPYSKKLSKEQWAMARVYSFLDGNPKHDTDLRRKTRRRHK